MSIRFNKKEYYNQEGFTLIEIIVSMAIFAVVAVVAAGALLKILDANKKAQSIQASITNLNFALESMTRELRVGSKYVIDNNGSSISFKSSRSAINPLTGIVCPPGESLINIYKFTDSTPSGTFILEKAEQPQLQSGQSCGLSYSGEGDFTPIISSKNVTITNYKISVISGGADEYPLASILISGFAGVREKDKTYFTVQTAASARAK